MTKQEILAGVRAELEKHVDVPYRNGAIAFFKEPVTVLGVRAATVRKIARQFYQEMSDWEKKEVFAICEDLLKQGYMELATVAFTWAVKRNREFVPKDIATFERWLDNYADNWAKVDDLCTHIIGELVATYPELVPRVKTWTASKNRWVRRGSAVSFINPNYTGRTYLHHVFEIAETLMMDEDDLVQKGYGWMLKVASATYPDEVLAFVIKHKAHMPRTALRYAIEKYPQNKRKHAMS